MRINTLVLFCQLYIDYCIRCYYVMCVLSFQAEAPLVIVDLVPTKVKPSLTISHLFLYNWGFSPVLAPDDTHNRCLGTPTRPAASQISLAIQARPQVQPEALPSHSHTSISWGLQFGKLGEAQLPKPQLEP